MRKQDLEWEFKLLEEKYKDAEGRIEYWETRVKAWRDLAQKNERDLLMERAKNTNLQLTVDRLTGLIPNPLDVVEKMGEAIKGIVMPPPMENAVSPDPELPEMIYRPDTENDPWLSMENESAPAGDQTDLSLDPMI